MSANNVTQFRKGFTKGSAERIAKAMKEREPQHKPGMPIALIANIDVIIQSALKEGKPAQLEIGVGPSADPNSAKTVRLIAIPSDYGEVNEELNERLIRVADKFGEVRTV